MYTIKQVPEDFIVKEIPLDKPSKDGIYSIYKLKKKNYTTADAIQRIAEFLRVKTRHIGYAGNKDRNAITEQFISIKYVSKTALESFQDKDIQLEFIERADEPISLGDLKGNHFEIIIRDADKKPKQIDKFINYFGEQRFGINNIDVGKAIIKKDFKKAAELIEHKKVKEALERNPTDYVGAIRMLPEKIILIYLHAFQSYIWNEMAKQMKNKEKLPIIGFATEYEDEEIEKAAKTLLEKEGITERDFIIKELSNLSQEGAERNTKTEIKNLKIEENENCKVSFDLDKGCYATEAVKAIMG